MALLAGSTLGKTPSRLASSLVFHAPFDQSPDAVVGAGDRRFQTGPKWDAPRMTEPGLPTNGAVWIDPRAGRHGGALRGEFGAQIDVEISATVLTMPDGPRLGFSIRDISRRLQGEERTPDRVSRSVSELTELVGRVPLKDIVSETTELIEQLCIEAALQMTHGNRASAAQLLGLSRQSLYVKLHRFGLGGGGSSDTDDEKPAVNID